jgi:hypothetical protein
MPSGDLAFWPLVARRANNTQKYLDGRTADLSVGIAPITLNPFGGTHWTAQELTQGIITLKLTLFQGGDRFLKGRPDTAKVELDSIADQVEFPCFWEPIIVDHQNDFDVWILRSMSIFDGPRFLDYRSADDSVGMAPFIDGVFGGTRWTLVPNPPVIIP